MLRQTVLAAFLLMLMTGVMSVAGEVDNIDQTDNVESQLIVLPLTMANDHCVPKGRVSRTYPQSFNNEVTVRLFTLSGAHGVCPDGECSADLLMEVTNNTTSAMLVDGGSGPILVPPGHSFAAQGMSFTASCGGGWQVYYSYDVAYRDANGVLQHMYLDVKGKCTPCPD